jgi:hypothetical protein
MPSVKGSRVINSHVLLGKSVNWSSTFVNHWQFFKELTRFIHYDPAPPFLAMSGCLPNDRSKNVHTNVISNCLK